MAKIVLLLVVYLTLAITVYNRLEGWPLIDCLYFTVVSFTTVGFGDLVPVHRATRLFITGHVFVELALFVLAFGRFLDRFVVSESSRMRWTSGLLSGPRVGQLAAARQRRRRMYVSRLAGVAAWVGVSAALGRWWLGLECWVDASYFAVVTLTTMGFGDLVPQTNLAKVGVSLLCLFGVPFFGATVASLAKFIYQGARDSRMDCIRTLTPSDLSDLQRFCSELEAAGAYSSAREGGVLKISPFEYLCFVLIRSDIATVQDVAVVMKNFEELDSSGDGYLEADDLGLRESPPPEEKGFEK